MVTGSFWPVPKATITRGFVVPTTGVAVMTGAVVMGWPLAVWNIFMLDQELAVELVRSKRYRLPRTSPAYT